MCFYNSFYNNITIIIINISLIGNGKRQKVVLNRRFLVFYPRKNNQKNKKLKRK